MARRKKQELEVEILSIAYGGLGVARPEDGPVVFVKGGVPGDRLSVRVTKKRKRHMEAMLLEVLRPSTLRVVPRCAHQSVCGGCPLQCLEYESQLEQKTRMVADSWQRIGGVDLPGLEPILECAEPWFYRNKMEFTFSDRQWVDDPEDPQALIFGLGQHARGIHSKVFDLKECHLQATWTAEVLEEIRRFVSPEAGEEADVWHYRDHVGFWRFVVIRCGTNSGEVMINVVTSKGGDPRPAQLYEILNRKFPGLITTFLNTVNSGAGQVASGTEQEVIHGEGWITETLCGLDFRLAPQAFFQTNTRQAQRLFELVAEMAQPTASMKMLDLYCGSGAIALSMAGRVAAVTGIEVVPEAIRDAKFNARQNGIDNAEFLCGDVKDLLDDEQRRDLDLVIVDPPRAGLHSRVIEQLGWIAAPRLVYVSCNPVTQARDAALLIEQGYRVKRLRPVDMFPHTTHVETVALFEREC